MKSNSESDMDEYMKNCEPDDSVSVPQHEGTPSDEAAGNVKRLSEIARKRKLTPEEKAQYEACQAIADTAGILPDEINEDDCTPRK